MHFPCAGITQHSDNLDRCGAPHDRVIHKNDLPAGNHCAIGGVFEIHAKGPYMLCRFNKRPADVIMVTDNTQFKRNAALLSIADGRRCAAISGTGTTTSPSQGASIARLFPIFLRTA